MSRTIVVPLDGSDRSEKAIPWAVELARATGDSITLIQVIPWSPSVRTHGMARYFSTDISDRLNAELHQAARDYLGRIQLGLQSEGIPVHVEVPDGNVIPTILDIADERGASAIVIASHGHGGLTRMMIGSVARQIAQEALIPVLVVRTGPGAEQQVSLRRILVPLDGSDLAESVLELVSQIAGTQTELVLARVVESILTPMPTVVDLGSVVNATATEKATALAEQQLTAQAEALRRVGVSVRQVVRVGRPGSLLRDLADELKVDLIAMATHGRRRFDRAILGSVADELVREAHQPVMLVSARALLTRALEPYAVRDVMTHNSTSVQSDEPLSAAVAKLLRRGLSASPVVNTGGEIVGVISEHDLLSWHTRLAAEMGHDESLLNPATYRDRLESTRVESIMTSPAVSVEAEAPLSAAVRLFLERHLRRLPVTANGALVGIISRADVLRTAVARVGHETEPTTSL